MKKIANGVPKTQCSKTRKTRAAFQLLTPDTVINLAESALGSSFSNLYRPFNSYINRVFELEQTDRTRRIIKFYRPSRWSREAILQEHEFLLELSRQEIPVIAPLQLAQGSTLGMHKDICFAVFPKCGGRCLDEYTDDQWLELGRLLGRTHTVGAMHGADARISLGPATSARRQADSILESGLVPGDLLKEFSQTVEEILREIQPLFDGIEMIRLHGDCHFANIIHRPQESFSLIDFDDMAIGPPVQDFWMLLPGLLDESFVEADLFLEGYETFRPFDRSTLRLIEPLRAMRYIHYMAWCIHQVVEDGETRVMDNFGTSDYWVREIEDLQDQLTRIRKPRKPMGNV
jgi:Ser/Thr protein kinase RdoA (MazF antagonist)